MKNVLITGAGGFIGRHCLPFLLERGYKVHATFNKSRPIEAGPVQWHQVDLMDSRRLTKLIDQVQPTHLLHFAWVTEHKAYWTSLANLDWVRSTLELLLRFTNRGGRRAVIAGTCAEYGWGGDQPFKESLSQLKPKTLYGVCKHALNLMVDGLATESGLSAAWGRVFFLYGPHEQPNRLVPSITRALLKGMTVPCSHGNQVRDYMYVKDAADAFVALLDSEVTGAVNIASGRPIELKTIIYKIAELIDNKDALIKLGALPVSPDDPEVILADVERLKDEVGWGPSFDLENGLEETINWWRKVES